MDVISVVILCADLITGLSVQQHKLGLTSHSHLMHITSVPLYAHM